MIPGETIASTADHSRVCSDCAAVLDDTVLRSAAGYYIGTACQCGPYSRESGYFPSREAAQVALESGAYGR